MHRFLVILLITGITASSVFAEDKWLERTRNGVLELKWKDLIPEDFHPEKLLLGKEFTSLSDDDPQAKKIMDTYLAEVDRAPTVASLKGRMVKIPGYVVPLEMDGEVMSEFLLVPYFGACIHVPPPPANQVVHVRAGNEETVASRSWWQTVWVTGRLSLGKSENDLASSNYVITAERVESYEKESSNVSSR